MRAQLKTWPLASANERDFSLRSTTAVYLTRGSAARATFSIHPEDAGPFLKRLGYRVLDVAAADELSRRYVHDGRRVHEAAYLVHASVARQRTAKATAAGASQ